MPRLRERAQDRMRIKDRRRHQFGRLVAGIAEHHALVAGTFILIAGSIDALRDIARLRVDEALDLCPLPVKPFLLVADVADRVPRHVDQHLAGDRGGAARLAGQDDAVCRRHRLDAAARLRLGSQVGIDDRVGNAVANLIGMALRDRLAGKNKIVRRQGPSPCKNKLHISAGRHEACHSGRNPTGPLSRRVVVECHAASVKPDLPGVIAASPAFGRRTISV